MNLLVPFIAIFALLMPAPRPVNHELTVTLYPAERRFEAVDSLTLPGSQDSFQFKVHKGLNPVSLTPGVKIIRNSEDGEEGTESFSLTRPHGVQTVELKYGGVIYHPVEPMGKEQARGEGRTTGIISAEGVFLSGASCWYPVFDGQGLLSLSLEVRLPPRWDAVGQGRRTIHEKDGGGTRVRWVERNPQEEIYLVAGKFTEYVREVGPVSCMAFLRSPDKELAERYLDATPGYIEMYDKLIGPYPYAKFALVENFWESGEAMPSFTLIGSSVMRLPFIVDSSYPHEILHDWWGNGVYADMSGGNWSEGITAYLADHLMKELKGAGAEYRREDLQKYADYVLSGRDFPISEFHERHSASTEAVGYGKALMFFHMLRKELGDEAFVKGLRLFYKRFCFRYATFADIEKCLEDASGKPLKAEFSQWVNRTGAPILRLGTVKAEKEGSGYLLSAQIEQVQAEDPYLLNVPIVVTLEGKPDAYKTEIMMNSKSLEAKVRLPERPLRLDIDPEFDLFRRLDKTEIPPAISGVLGAKKMLVVLPSKADKKLLEAYRDLASMLKDSGPDEVEVKQDADLTGLPDGEAVVVLGYDNFFGKQAEDALSGFGVSFKDDGVRIGSDVYPLKASSIVLTARNKDASLMFISSANPQALSGLGRKLPHYGKYGYLVFEGDGPRNIAKGKWPVLQSPLTAFLQDNKGQISRVTMGRLVPERPLAAPPPSFSGERMMETIRYLSSDELKGRGFGSEGLNKAASYIAEKFREAGLTPGGTGQPAPGGDESYFQEWVDRGGEPQREAAIKNVIGTVLGCDPAEAGQCVVVGAHYDHLGLGWPDVREGNKGKVHPGADDNASGVSVLLELARALSHGPAPKRSIVFVAFTGEEAGRRGSEYYISHETRYPAKKAVGMINLDTVGRLGKNKLLILGADTAGEWEGMFRDAGAASGVDVAMVREKLDSSDNVSFEDAGVPAVQLFDGPNLDYHRPTDTADKIDPEGLVKVASVADRVIEQIASSEAKLSSTIGPPEKESAAGMTRKVGVGTIPDFTYEGRGYRISGTTPGSPAEAAGLKEGDVIIRVNSDVINGLKDFSRSLKALSPGMRITITFVRNEKEMSSGVTVTSR